MIALEELCEENPADENLRRDYCAIRGLMNMIVYVKDDSIGYFLPRMELAIDEIGRSVQDMPAGKFNPWIVKLHILCRHATSHALESGCLRNVSTAFGETSHISSWELFRRSTGNFRELKRMLQDSLIVRAFEEACLPEPSPDIMWTTPWNPVGYVRLMKHQSSGSRVVTSAEVRSSILEVAKDMIRDIGGNIDDVEFGDAMESLLNSFQHTRVTLSKSVLVGVRCATRDVWIIRPDRVMAGDPTEALAHGPPLECVTCEPGCLDHAGISAMCSNRFNDSGLHAYPLLFMSVASKVWAAVFPLETSPYSPENETSVKVQGIVLRIEVVHGEHIRGREKVVLKQSSSTNRRRILLARHLHQM